MSAPMRVHLTQPKLHPVNRFWAQEHRFDRRLEAIQVTAGFDILFKEVQVLLLFFLNRVAPNHPHMLPPNKFRQI